MHYFIGDIHGCYNKLIALMKKLNGAICPDDTMVFLGDYIDRGPGSFEVVEYLIDVSSSNPLNFVFLKGNHECMLLNYISGLGNMFLSNGGMETVASYRKNRKGRFSLPSSHMEFFSGLRLFYEGDDFIAVHAGLNPGLSMLSQSEEDMLWIREKFYRADNRWEKTIIFGHTPAGKIKHGSTVYFDDKRNIIGIDSDAVYGGTMRCLSWPDRKILVGY
jgi:serine/threonine protein phosphatase 1